LAKALHFDCFSGASGDMILGALLDLGVPLDGLRAALGSLSIDYGDVSAARVVRSGISATKFRVHEHGGLGTGEPGPSESESQVAGEVGVRRAGHDHVHGHSQPHHHHDGDLQHHHPTSPGESHVGPGGTGHDHDHDHHSLREISAFIDRSALSPSGKARAKHLFERLAQAEATVHDVPIDRIHLHEVGAIDSIVDIVGAVYALEWIGAAHITASPLNVGSGTVRCAHGVLPVPAPATTRLLAGAPVYAGAVASELLTPTGALIITDYATVFGSLPPMRIDKVGYGAGDRDFPGHPNVLRIFLGDTGATAAAERVVTIECEIDDMNPQLFGPLMDRLYATGALDVYYAAVMMKKNRPGVLVTVLAQPEQREAIAGVLFSETTTIGVRYQEVMRERLAREIVTVPTPLGTVRFKIASRDGRVVNAAPEFDDCARLAAEHNLPVKHVQALALKAWLDTR
jgi:pyridinium-3,5-bisthiocarboxylic acid mononucleotide nickel chelatase